jgi:hypothetical protein
MTLLMTIVLLGISIAIFVWYRQLVIKRFGIQKSYSHSYTLFDIGGKQRTFVIPFVKVFHWTGISEQIYYTIFMWGISIPVMIVSDSVWGFLAGAILCIDGGARTGSGIKLTQFLHDWGAKIGIGLGAVMLIAFSWWYLLLVIPLAVMVPVCHVYVKNGTWRIEEIAYIVILLGLIIEKVFIQFLF